MIKITSPKKFAEAIELLVVEKKLTYIDSVVYYCEVNEIEIQVASKLINTKMKAKIEIEARQLNFLEKEAADDDE